MTRIEFERLGWKEHSRNCGVFLSIAKYRTTIYGKHLYMVITTPVGDNSDTKQVTTYIFKGNHYVNRQELMAAIARYERYERH